MFPPTGDQQHTESTIPQVSIPPAHAVEETPGVSREPDVDDVPDDQLAAMTRAFFGQGQPVQQPQPPPQQPEPAAVQPPPAGLPVMRYRPTNPEEASLIQTAKAQGVGILDLIFPPAPVAAAAPVIPAVPQAQIPFPVTPVAPVPPVQIPEAAPPVQTPEPQTPPPAAPVEDGEVAAAKAALVAAQAEFAEVARLKADEPWTTDLSAREAAAIAALSGAGTRVALAEQSAVSRAAAQADSAAQAALEYQRQQTAQISAHIPEWASSDPASQFVQARNQVYSDLVAAGDPRMQSPDWQRHLLQVVLARTGYAPSPAPQVQQPPVAVFNPPAFAGNGAPTAARPMTADQMEQADWRADQYDPHASWRPRIIVG